LKEAENLQVDVMDVSRRVLGAEHPGSLICMNNLAEIYKNQGKFKEAEELIKKGDGGQEGPKA
jgi:Tetratricopeptide repeat